MLKHQGALAQDMLEVPPDYSIATKHSTRPPGPCHQGRKEVGGRQEGGVVAAEEYVVRGSER